MGFICVEEMMGELAFFSVMVPFKCRRCGN